MSACLQPKMPTKAARAKRSFPDQLSEPDPLLAIEALQLRLPDDVVIVRAGVDADAGQQQGQREPGQHGGGVREAPEGHPDGRMAARIERDGPGGRDGGGPLGRVALAGLTGGLALYTAGADRLWDASLWPDLAILTLVLFPATLGLIWLVLPLRDQRAALPVGLTAAVAAVLFHLLELDVLNNLAKLFALVFLGFWFLFQLWQGGFSLVAPGTGGPWAESDCVSCGACVDTCPTGALSEPGLLNLLPIESYLEGVLAVLAGGEPPVPLP